MSDVTSPRELYRSVVAYMEANGANLADAARSLGVKPGTARAWRKRYGASIEPAEVTPVERSANQPKRDPKTGRPKGTPRLTLEVQEKICESLREGVSREGAANLAGFSGPTVMHWLRDGLKDPEGPYGAFATAYTDAEAELELSAVKRIVIGKSDWRALAWLLERRFPTRWGNRTVVENRLTNATGDGPAEIDVVSVLEDTLPKLTPEQLLALAGERTPVH